MEYNTSRLSGLTGGDSKVVQVDGSSGVRVLGTHFIFYFFVAFFRREKHEREHDESAKYDAKKYTAGIERQQAAGLLKNESNPCALKIQVKIQGRQESGGERGWTLETIGRPEKLW